MARITGGVEAPQQAGCVAFYQEGGCVLVIARISGLPKESETGFFGQQSRRPVSTVSCFILCCNGFFSVVSFCVYTIFTPQRHEDLWKYMVFCELNSLKNHCDMGLFEGIIRPWIGRLR